VKVVVTRGGGADNRLLALKASALVLEKSHGNVPPILAADATRMDADKKPIHKLTAEAARDAVKHGPYVFYNPATGAASTI